jgi:hypothetical protein
MTDLLLPNIAGNVQQQYMLGQQQQANKLIGQAFANPDQQSALLGNAATLDPRAAMAAQQYFTQQQTDQQNQQYLQQQRDQQTQQQQTAKMVGAAQYMINAVQSGDPNKIQGAYENVKPLLAQAGSAQGKVPPDQFDPSMLPHLYAIAAMGGAQPVKGVVMNAGSQLRDPATGTMLASVPYAPEYENAVPSGNGTAAGVFDRNTGTLKPAVPGAQPSAPASAGADPMDALIAQANQAVQMGADPNKVQAWLVSQAQAGGMQPTAPNASPNAAPASAPLAMPSPQTSGAAPVAQFGMSGPKQPAAPSGYAYQPDGTLKAIPGGPADKGSGSSLLGTSQATGQQYLASIPDVGLRNLVQAISEGREQVPRIYKGSTGGTVGATEIAAAVSQFDPSFNAADYQSRLKARESFAPGGNDYKNMISLDQVTNHLQQLHDLIPDTAGHAIPFVGSYVNAAQNAATDPYTGKVTAWNQASQKVAEEATKLFAGGRGGTLDEVKQNLAVLNANSSQAQKEEAIKTLANLIQSRVGILRQGYEQGMGRARDPFAIAFPESAQALNKLAGNTADYNVPANGQFQPPAASTQPSGWSIQKVQ